MFGIAEFLQDYSKDPKYRAVWQASSSTDTYLEPIEGNEEGTITSVEELTKNVGDLICGRDLRGVVAQRVSNSEVFRVSAELSSRLFLGVMHILNDQVDSFKMKASNSYWEARKLAQENFEIIGHKKKISLLASLGKRMDSQTEAACGKIYEILSDDEDTQPGEVTVVDLMDVTGAQDVTRDEDLAAIVQRVAELAETPARRSNKKLYGRRQLMNIPEEPAAQLRSTPVREALPEEVHTPRFVETPQQEPDEQDAVQMMMERVNNLQNEVDGASVKRRRRENRLIKEASQGVEGAPKEVDPLNALDALLPSANIPFDLGTPGMNDPFGALPEANGDAAPQPLDAEMNAANQADGAPAETPSAKRKKAARARINQLLCSPLGPNADIEFDLHSEATPAKKARKPHKKRRQEPDLEESIVNAGLFNASGQLELARDADAGRRRSSRIRNMMSATPVLQNEALLPEIRDQISDLRLEGRASQRLHTPNIDVLPEIGALRTPSPLEPLGAVQASRPLVDFAANFSRVSLRNENQQEDVRAEETPYEALVFNDFKKSNGPTTFGQMLSSCQDRRAAMERFMGLMRLAKTKVLNVKQDNYMGSIQVSAGSNFNIMSTG